jgi:hypothetical protein
MHLARLLCLRGAKTEEFEQLPGREEDQPRQKLGNSENMILAMCFAYSKLQCDPDQKLVPGQILDSKRQEGKEGNELTER